MTDTASLSFEDLDPALIADAEEYLATVLKEEFPSFDLTKSRVLRDELIRPAAIMHALNRTDNDRLRRSRSPLEIAEDPSLADDEIVDATFSIYRVARFEGQKATGTISIIIPESATTVVPETTIFETNGLQYVVAQTYIGVTSPEAVVTSSERLIEERTDGNFVFTVPVTAVDVGEEFRVERDTRFSASPAIPDSIDLVAVADFEGGLDSQTNEELVEQTQLGISPLQFAGRIQTESLIVEEFPSVQALSQVGFGDQEMLRDRHNIFEVSQGGKTDLYLRTADTSDEVKITKVATYLGDMLWQITLLRDDAPGFHLVTSVVEKDLTNFSGSLPIVGEARGLDLTPETDFVQQIEGGLLEGAYSRYQTAIVQFLDNNTPLTALVGDTTEYDIRVLRMPDIRGINDLAVDRGQRPPAGDYLPRAVVPAFTSVTLKILQRPGTADPDIDAVKLAVASRANSIGFQTGRLDMALLVDAAQGALETRGTAVVSPIDMTAVIYPPDTVPLGWIKLRDPHVLVIPDLPERGVSQRTTNFLLSLSSISISVEKMDTLPI